MCQEATARPILTPAGAHTRWCRSARRKAYRVSVVRNQPEPDQPNAQTAAEERRRLEDELIGLDSEHPEVRAFSEHLDRAHRHRPSFTVEGYLSGVSEFADSANRAQGLKRVGAVLMVVLILLGVAFTLWEASLFIVSTLLG
jgi:hypothetical protein